MASIDSMNDYNRQYVSKLEDRIIELQTTIRGLEHRCSCCQFKYHDAEVPRHAARAIYEEMKNELA